jgi:hypothetical protein
MMAYITGFEENRKVYGYCPNRLAERVVSKLEAGYGRYGPFEVRADEPELRRAANKFQRALGHAILGAAKEAQ